MALLEEAPAPQLALSGARKVTSHLRQMVATTAVADGAVIAGALLVAWKLRLSVEVWPIVHDPGLVHAHSAAPWIAIGWVLVLAAQGAYSTRHLGAGPEEFRTVATASVMTAGLTAMFCYIAELSVSRGFLLLGFVIGTPLLVLERYAARKVLHRLRLNGQLVHRVVAIGGPSAVAELMEVLHRERHVGYQVLGVCVPRGLTFDPSVYDVPVVGTAEDARSACEALGADTVMVTRGGYGSANELRQIAWDLEGSDLDLVVVPTLVDVAGPRVHMRPVAGLPLLHVEPPQAGEAGGFDKRFFDIAGALLALVVLAPIMAAVALAIKLEDRGPVLFQQRRIGRGGQEFACLKFRSMVVDADRMEQRLRALDGHTTALWKMKRDPRITRVGAFIRKYSLDELPQLFNVVAGEMSLVGPRPQQRWEVETYTDATRRRLLVRPGMTGLWQVSGRSELSLEESVRLDLYYVDNWSMAGDLVIMAKTVKAVLASSGAY